MLGKRDGRDEDMSYSYPEYLSPEMGDEHGEQEPQQFQPRKQKPKALKFVTNYGAPHPKRRRIGAACVTCRKRKTGCSGERPACETCKQNKLECGGYSAKFILPGEKSRGQKRRTSDASAQQRPSDLNNGSEDLSRRNNFPRGPQIQQELYRDSNLSGAKNINYDGCPPPPTPRSRAEAPAPTARLGWTRSGATNGLPPNHTMDADGAAGGVQASSETVQNDERERQASLFSGPRNRMPYFRWLGPTAIMPGFKQMVVKVKRQDTDPGQSSTDGGAAATAGLATSPSLNGGLHPSEQRGVSSIYGATPGTTMVDGDVRTPLNLPFYDTSRMPPSELITHLANTFFTHLGCNYPFLQRERFLRDLEEKQVDAILVDAVCAIAARFSTHSLLTEQSNDENKATPPEYGHAFAQRAKTALVDTFPCPSVAAVQAALLLAYNEFGESRDSGLWMYLGISIRMAQDLGMHKLEGLKYKGKSGPTPKMIKRESMSGSPELPLKLVGGDRARRKSETPREKVIGESAEATVDATDQADEKEEVDEQKAVEQERVDTFWAVFFLDRVVSSGTGRRSTLRDKDIELSFPALDETGSKTGWPSCFPALIRIVHLYGRVADLLNSIKEPSDITTETPKRLASMESQVTNFYQGLSSRLHFDAVNFQHYMKVGEGTNFVLLHFWFHTLIVLLHQPTLLKTFEGRMLQLFPNSRQLSISSAKTIADILSYSQLMDAKASLGNPFTTQPIYIAACAFLKETIEQTATSNAQSRASSPTRREKSEKWNAADGSSRPGSSMNGTLRSPLQTRRMSISDLSNHTNTDSAGGEGSKYRRTSSITVEQHKSSDKSEGSALSAAKTASSLAKHTLLATAASQHYKLCYKALQSLETYWAGAKYILTVLDQKFEGVGDPLLYTVEEGESAMERPRPEPSFTTPGWRRKLSWGPYLYNPNVVGSQDFWMEKAGRMAGSPSDLSKAIGWTLTGTMNSPSTNLAWHYPSGTTANGTSNGGQQQPATNMQTYDTGVAPNADLDTAAQQNVQYSSRSQTTPSTSHAPPTMTGYPSNASADMLMDLGPPFQTNSKPSHDATTVANPFGTLDPANTHDAFTSTGDPNLGGQVSSAESFNGFNAWTYPNLWNPNSNASGLQFFGDMMIESQDVEMSMLGLDMMPWFENYPTHDLNGLFNDTSTEPPATSGAHGPV